MATSSCSNGAADTAANGAADAADSAAQQAALAPEPARGGAGGCDVVTLNVGGQLFSCHRSTLCCVEDSLLATMFSGRWPVDAVDAAGHVFVDLDPSLFEVALNWLRTAALGRPGRGPLRPPRVDPAKLDLMLAMLDYLQLHRHVPLEYAEAFDEGAASPFITVRGETASRARHAALHPGQPKADNLGQLMQFAVSERAYYDMELELELEVTRFAGGQQDAAQPGGRGGGGGGSISRGGGGSSSSSRRGGMMFLGFIPQAAAAAQLDPRGSINTQLTKQPGCYGWLTGRGAGYTVRNGQRAADPCSKDLLWREGDRVALSLDCRRGKDSAQLVLHNTTSGLSKSMDACANPSSSSSSSSAAEGGDDAGGKAGKCKRAGRRHRQSNMRARELAAPDRSLLLQLLQFEPPSGNAQLVELVVAAALQVMEAEGVPAHQALRVMASEGWMERNVRGVEEVLQATGHKAPAAAAAAAIFGARSGDVEAAAAALTAALGRGPPAGCGRTAARIRLPTGELLPASTSEYEWVLVVGLVAPADSVRLLTARRKGQWPGPASAAPAASA